LLADHNLKRFRPKAPFGRTESEIKSLARHSSHGRWLLNTDMANLLHNIRLDYVSCVLTVLGTILLGKKLWQGWVVAGLNSAVVCVIGIRTAQFGFVPANLLCIALYAGNLFRWRFTSPTQSGERRQETAT
jgi:membrane-bound ClpP family serine protease